MGPEPFGSSAAAGPAGARSGNPPLSPCRVGNVLAAGAGCACCCGCCFGAGSAAGRAALPSQLFSAGPVRPGRPEASGRSVRVAPGTRAFCSPNAEKVDWSAAAAEAPGVRVGRPLLVVGGGNPGASPEDDGGKASPEGGGKASPEDGGGKPEGGGGKPDAPEEEDCGTEADARPGGVNPAGPNGPADPKSGCCGSPAGAGGAHADCGCCDPYVEPGETEP
ncbi:hypothetical protein L3i22_000750 [Actinoplanes sp. L3-i22]|nr:hypothetical protein L3i22_000750 [Actinoplanes sp. L3-i22]